jgi:formylglycine-generating enzyme required for sulfatase activity
MAWTPLVLALGMTSLGAGAEDRGAHPAWASSSGHDAAGAWADLVVQGVTQRFRLIPPGHFIMGSSVEERAAAVSGAHIQADWIGSEVAHPVTLTQGFWLADSSCTQALWQAVMGANPSNFTGDPERPVEQVSYLDCQNFLARLHTSAPDAAARLPTEAEWEYACRAGTSTATYAGNLVYLGQFNAPILDPIAWYGGNSGVGPEVAAAIDTSLWTERQYPSDLSATHPVKWKQPNAWGLYDMIGNVWNWCSDWYGDYPSGPVSDPHGPPTGSDHVTRGGSWGLSCWYCRAAERIANAPGSRWNSLGMRVCIATPP